MWKTCTTIALALSVGIGAASAQSSWPDRTVKIVVPYAAGGPTDIAGRLVAQELSARLKQSFVVENRAGAGGNLGAEIVSKAPADGYTLLLVGVAHAVNRSLHRQLPYDMQKDFTPVALVTRAPLVLVAHPGFPARSVKDLVDQATARPGEVAYASQGNGTAGHLAMEMLRSATGTKMIHVPYKGSAPALADLVAGQVQVAFDSVVGAQAYIAAGKLTTLGITGNKRSALMPSVPTLAESGYPMVDATVWYGVVAPTGTPATVVELLNRNINEILQSAEVRDRVAKLGAEPAPETVDNFGKMIAAEIAKWATVVKESGAKVD